MFTNNNLEQIRNQGLTVELIEEQLNNFRQGFPPMRLIAPAIPQNGIKILSEDEESRYISIFENSLSSGLNTMKFVPASGAASRMFKDLYEFLETGEENDFINDFFTNLKKFAFHDELKSLVTTDNKKELIALLLNSEGLNFGNLPKGLLPFHKYNGFYRTPFEEHLIEAASYCTGNNGNAKIHFTISPEHEEGFNRLAEKIVPSYQKKLGVRFDIGFSFQHPSTDTIAANTDNTPYIDNEGRLLFRPGGHGALIENLSELDADLIFIKNIDNVVPDRLKHFTKRYKKALAGMLVELRNKLFAYLEKLDKPNAAADEDLLKNIEMFMKKELGIQFDSSNMDPKTRVLFLQKKLNRPIRICGMVKNEGEPGGGPFWAKNNDQTVSLQIVEKVQIDLNDPKQLELLNQSTHFNPVDLICSIKNYKGEKFELVAFRDSQTGFISSKSKDGVSIKALELPGLWNGAMSDWNTVFVEVPVETFNPVKTINDLLRNEHQQ